MVFPLTIWSGKTTLWISTKLGGKMRHGARVFFSLPLSCEKGSVFVILLQIFVNADEKKTGILMGLI